MTKSFFDESNIEGWKKLSAKDGALRFIEFMETAARDPSSDKALGDAQKETLKAAREGLRAAFEILIHSMIASPSDVSYEAIWRLLAHSFAIGQHVGFLDVRAQKAFDNVRAWSATLATLPGAKRLATLLSPKASVWGNRSSPASSSRAS
jgi:hypothetical protein